MGLRHPLSWHGLARATLWLWLWLWPCEPARADAAEDLAAARLALNKSDLAAAEAAYAKIHADNPLWPERLTDSWRFHLLAGRYNEAWRFTELATRTGVVMPHLAYMRILSQLKARVCTLPQRPPEATWQFLLAAHIYRFAARFQPASYHDEPLRDAVLGPLTAHLGPLQTHFLGVIPRASLIAGTGCRWYASSLRDRDSAKAEELQALRSWYTASREPGAERLAGSEAVGIRLLELAVAPADDGLRRELLASYAAFDAAAWWRTPDPERRFIWQKLVAGGLYPAPPYGATSDKGLTVMAIVLHTNTTDAAEWMGLLDPVSIPANKLEQLYSHLLTIAGMPSQPYLLAEQARAAYQRGAAPEALAFIRRLLLLDEAAGESDVERVAAQLAARIFAEYRYDAAILGALQNTLPSGTWGSIFRRQLVVHALTGNRAGFELLQKTISSTRQERAVRLLPQEQAVLTAMVRRQSAGFAAALRGLVGSGRMSGITLSFFAELAAEVVGLSAAERGMVSPYLQAIGAVLRRQATGGLNQKTLLELIRLFEGHRADAYTQGGETVREGTVEVGVADLTRASSLPFPFHWNPPLHLPLRELLVMPSDATGRAWHVL